MSTFVERKFGYPWTLLIFSKYMRNEKRLICILILYKLIIQCSVNREESLCMKHKMLKKWYRLELGIMSVSMSF
jgi:hypothetical protein